jgi:hypothetical protein
MDDVAALSTAVAKCYIILSLLGPSLSNKDIDPTLYAAYYKSSIFPAMRQHGVRRIFAMGILTIVRPEDRWTFLQPVGRLFMWLFANTLYQNGLNIAATFDSEAHDLD